MFSTIKQKSVLLIETFLLFFIIVQPILDVFISIGMKETNSPLSIGILVRTFAMGLGFLFLFLIKDTENKKYAIGYLLFMFLYFFVNLATNYAVKDPFELGAEIKFFAKISYFPIMFFTYVYVFKRFPSASSWNVRIQKYVYLAMMVICGVMVASMATNTAFQSYNWDKLGYSGWYYSANELGTILAIAFPVVGLYVYSKITSIKNVYYWIAIIAMLFSLLAIGTKVGYGAALFVLVALAFFSVIRLFGTQKSWLHLGLSVATLAVFIWITPHTYIAYNQQWHSSWLTQKEAEMKKMKTVSETTKTKEAKKHTKKSSTKKPVEVVMGCDTERKNETFGSESKLIKLLLSSREIYIHRYVECYKEAPSSQQLLGMGYAGNYKEEPKTIEMDFYDLYFSLGIVGFFVYFIGYIAVLAVNAWWMIRYPKHTWTMENWMIWLGIIMGLGISFLAGHVLTAPSVAIYLIVLSAYLTVNVRSSIPLKETD